jgi:hypothetical protein
MKMKMLVTLLGAFVLVTGCVSTVNDRSTAAVPFVKDKFEARYQRPVDQVYTAAAEVAKNNGTITRESIVHPGPNQIRTIEAKIKGRNVWVRVQGVDPSVTAVTVQVRTAGGGTDLDLTQQLQTQIAVKLASR